MSFTIPAKPAEADALAGELGELATATEWKRAAIVYARVKVGDHGGDRSKINNDLASGKITPNEYALRQIHGLRSATTIRAYWRAWDNAVTEGIAQPVNLGDEIELPDAEWGDYYNPQTHITPPYYRPEEEPLDPQVLDRRLMFNELGECPPRASDLASGEGHEFSVVRDLLNEVERHECENIGTQELVDEEDDDADIGPQALSGQTLQRWMAATYRSAKIVLDLLDGYDEFDDTEAALKSLAATREVLTDIESVLTK